MNDRIMVTVEMPTELKNKIAELAKSREMTTSALIRLVLKEYLAKEDNN